MDEQKESKITIQRLTEQAKQLKIAAIDVNKYETWDWEQLLGWILSCDNGIFKKYEEDLTKNISTEQPSGVDLKDVDSTDVRRWGVTKFSDIKILSYNIRQLMDNSGNNVPFVANEEGGISGGHYK